MATIEEDYVSFETAKLLEEKGFNEHCLTSYNSFLSNHKVEKSHISEWGRAIQIYRPSQAMAMKWLREVYNLRIDVDPSEGDWNPTVLELEDWSCVAKPGDELPIQDSYEEACEVAIKYTLKNLI